MHAKSLWLDEVGRMQMHLETLYLACFKEEFESVAVSVSARQKGWLMWQ